MKAIFVFYNVATGLPALLAFNKKFKHVSVLISHDESWVGFDCGGRGIHHQLVDGEKQPIENAIEGLKSVPQICALVAIELNEADRAFVSWKPFVVRSCNELCRYLTGIDVGFTLNPYHLHKKLFKHAGRNYQITHMWERF